MFRLVPTRIFLICGLLLFILSAGYYCGQEGLSAVTGECAAGYYCPAAQVTDSPIDYICPVAHYCETGSAAPTPCASGTYQNEQGQSECKTCPEVGPAD